jgi:hypothetical protein
MPRTRVWQQREGRAGIREGRGGEETPSTHLERFVVVRRHVE